MKQPQPRRKRGLILTAVGLRRLQAAIQAAELREKDGRRFNQEELSNRMRVSTTTVSRLWSLSASLDQRTLKLCFSAFDLDLRPEDYISPDESSELDPASEAGRPPVALAPAAEDGRRSEGWETPLKYPSGPVPLDSIFYIPRPPIEELACQEVTQPGCVIRIKAPREMGKSSLLFRMLAHAKLLGYCRVHLDLSRTDDAIFNNLDRFLRWLCLRLSQELQIPAKLDEFWDEQVGSKVSCTLYLKEQVLEHLECPFILALNEINRVFEYPELAREFLPLLRSWQEEAQQPGNWQKLRLVVVYSTEVYIPLDLNQSPFNVGLPLQLPEFNQAQVQELAKRHGLTWWGDREAEQLMAVVGGHPALVRIALYHLWRNEGSLEQLMQAASSEAGIYRAHLRRHLIALRQNRAMANAYEAVICNEGWVALEPVVAYKLESLGLVQLSERGAKVSRELYRRYFRLHLFQTE